MSVFTYQISKHTRILTLATSLSILGMLLSACTDSDTPTESTPQVAQESSNETPDLSTNELNTDKTVDATASVDTEAVAKQAEEIVAPVIPTLDEAAENINQNADNAFAQPDSENSQLFTDIVEKISRDKPALDYQIEPTPAAQERINQACQKIDAKLASVSLEECTGSQLRLSPYSSESGTPILITEFPPLANRKPLGRVLLIGGTHGDELTSVSIVFKWITILQQYHSGLFHWHIAPVMNPDGVLTRKATRQNARGVDLNRNMPTPDWQRLSQKHWQKISRDPRKNPGADPASESETQWLIHEIATFKPDAIVSVHAPYGILDFDGPDLSTAPKKFGRLRLNLLGTYPGSLGNYAGISRDIPVLTLELPHAWVMPKQYEINSIWTDMVRWLRSELGKDSAEPTAAIQNESLKG